MIRLSALQYYPEVETAVRACIAENAIGQSEYIEQFEQALCDYTGAHFAVAVSSGSMADAVLVAAMREIYNVRNVILPALTFIAQPNAVRMAGCNVIFADIRDDYLIDETRLGEYVLDHQDTMLFVTSLLGRVPTARAYPYITVEDACEAFGSSQAGRQFMAGTFSFYPSHTISTGEGGAIITDNAVIAQMCRKLRNHGRADEYTTEAPFNKFHFDRFGFNAKMSGLQAAVGLGMMAHVREIVERRKSIFATMHSELGGWFSPDVVPHGFTVRFDRMDNRDRAMITLTDAGIECRRLFSCIPYREDFWRARKRDCESFPYASLHADHTLYVPCHNGLTDADVAYIIYNVKRLLGRLP